jgi:hypothetical protein
MNTLVKPSMTRRRRCLLQLWPISFAIWCIYWWTCETFNKNKYGTGIHWDLTYVFFGWFRSRFLDLGADTHPHWSDYRHYRQHCTFHWADK